PNGEVPLRFTSGSWPAQFVESLRVVRGGGVAESVDAAAERHWRIERLPIGCGQGQVGRGQHPVAVAASVGEEELEGAAFISGKAGKLRRRSPVELGHSFDQAAGAIEDSPRRAAASAEIKV